METLLVVSAVVSAAAAVSGGVLSAKGAKAQAEAEAQAAEYNRQIAAAEASAEEERIRRRNRLALAEQRAGLAKLGIEVSGTPLERLADTATEYEYDALGVRRFGESSSQLERMRGRAALKAGRLAAKGAIISGIGQAAGAFSGVKLGRAPAPKSYRVPASGGPAAPSTRGVA